MSRLINHILFRNGSGFPPKSAENKEAYHPNAPDFKRHRCGTICGKSISGETAMVLNCLILTSKGAKKSLLFAVKGWFLTKIMGIGDGVVGRGKGQQRKYPLWFHGPEACATEIRPCRALGE
jgi:hypothetical protein